MSTASISPILRSSILSFWREKPLRPDLLAAEFLKEHPNESASKAQIADVVRRNKQFAVYSDVKTKHVHERFGEFEQRRGGLVFVDSAHFRRRFIGGPHFVILATDAYSKATYVEAVKRLTGGSVARAFEKIILRFFQGPIKTVISDFGSEYVSHEFKSLCASYGIEHRTTTPSFSNKAWAAERRIKQLRRILARIRTSSPGGSFNVLLEKAEYHLNHVAVNSITGLTPQETTNNKAPFVLLKLRRHRAKIVDSQPKEKVLHLGDPVLLRLPTGVFDKSDDPKYSTEVYTIVGVKPTAPRLSYRLRGGGETIVGSFPASRLALVERDSPSLSPSSPSPHEETVPSYSPPVTRSKAIFSRLH